MGTLQEAMAKLLRQPKKKTDDDVEHEAQEARKGAQRAADLLPEGVMPHEALRKKKERMQTLDEETKE